MPLLRYANLFLNYKNCTVWSPPECMKNPKKLLEPTY